MSHLCRLMQISWRCFSVRAPSTLRLDNKSYTLLEIPRRSRRRFFISALRSSRGASFKLLQLVGNTDKFEINLSVPLILEYEDVAHRQFDETGLTSRDVNDILDYLCGVANARLVHFLWRPFLKDPKDDMLLELALAAGEALIISFNLRDFAGIEQFGLRAVTPQEFLKQIGEHHEHN